MGIYLRKQMPKSCDVCDFVETDDKLMTCDHRYLYCGFPGMGQFVSDYEASRHPDCPLNGVPKHGRLIDADELLKDIEKAVPYGRLKYVPSTMVEDATTIIPADMEELE